MSERQWATETEATEHARVSASTLRRWRVDGLIGSYKVRGARRYDLTEIDSLIGNSQDMAR